MDCCTVSASELFQLAKDMLNDGNDFVSISLLESDGEMPDAVSFEAWKSRSDHAFGYGALYSADT